MNRWAGSHLLKKTRLAARPRPHSICCRRRRKPTSSLSPEACQNEPRAAAFSASSTNEAWRNHCRIGASGWGQPSGWCSFTALIGTLVTPWPDHEKTSFFLFTGNRLSSQLYAPTTVGPDARVNCETGQVRKEAAISMLWSGAVGSPTLDGACAKEQTMKAAAISTSRKGRSCFCPIP